MDEWDKIILAKSDMPEDKPVATAVVPAETSAEKEEAKISPLKPDQLRPDTAAFSGFKSALAPVISPAATLKKEEAPTKALPLVGILSPYVSKLPALWSLDLAGKFATIALALAVSFGVYSFSVHISNLGFEKTLAGTVDSVLTRVGNTSIIVASLFDTKNNGTESQLASPFAAVQVFDAGSATTSEQLFPVGDADFVAGTAEVVTVKLDKVTATSGPSGPTAPANVKAKPVSPKPASKVVPIADKTEPPTAVPTNPPVQEVVIKDGIYIVGYGNAGFSPKSLEIGSGKTVRFVNNSAVAMRVIDTTGTYLSRTFSQLKTVGSGGTYEYTFNDAGTYEYANQNNSTDRGTIIVK